MEVEAAAAVAGVSAEQLLRRPSAAFAWTTSAHTVRRDCSLATRTAGAHALLQEPLPPPLLAHLAQRRQRGRDELRDGADQHGLPFFEALCRRRSASRMLS